MVTPCLPRPDSGNARTRKGSFQDSLRLPASLSNGPDLQVTTPAWPESGALRAGKDPLVPLTIPRPATTSGTPNRHRMVGGTTRTPPAFFNLGAAAWTVDNVLLREEKRRSGGPFPPGRRRTACWRGPARDRGLVIVLGRPGYSDRTGIIVLGIPVMVIERELFSPALQSPLRRRSENQ